MPSVLFICTANICRSPMAMALLREKVEQEPDAENWRIESAGTWAQDDEPAAKKSIQTMEERGLDIHNHSSRVVTGQMLENFNLILTMERGHKESLQAEFPAHKESIYTLSEMIDLNYDIPDPFGGSLAEYKATAEEIDRILAEGYQKICQLARKKAAVEVS